MVAIAEEELLDGRATGSARFSGGTTSLSLSPWRTRTRGSSVRR